MKRKALWADSLQEHSRVPRFGELGLSSTVYWGRGGSEFISPLHISSSSNGDDKSLMGFSERIKNIKYRKYLAL